MEVTLLLISLWVKKTWQKLVSSGSGTDVEDDGGMAAIPARRGPKSPPPRTAADAKQPPIQSP